MSKNNAVVMQISNADYHSGEGYSSSLIKKIGVPAEAKYSMDNAQGYKECFTFGSALHSYVLEPELFDSQYIIPMELRRAGKENKATWSEWFNDYGADGEAITANPAAKWNELFELQTGKNLITQDQLHIITKMGASVDSSLCAMDLLSRGKAEQSIYWDDEETGLKLKIRPDYLGAKIVDLKSIKAVDDKTIWNQVNNLGYAVSASMYQDGIMQLCGEYKPFTFIFISKEAPYLIRNIELPVELMEAGWNDYRDGVRALAECLETDKWPGYQDEIEELKNPYFKRRDVLEFDK